MKTMIAAFGLIAGIGASAPAQATTIVQTASFGPAPADYYGVGSGSALLNLFNTSLGTLNSVSIITSYGFNSTITVGNSGASSANGAVRVESAAGFGSTNANVNVALNTMVNRLGSITVGGATINPAAYDLLGSNRTYNLNAGQFGVYDSSVTAQIVNSGIFTGTSILSAFSGTGISFFNAQLFTATSTLLTQSGGNVFASNNTTATGSFQLTYDYTATPTSAIPEPASWAMMIGGFGLVGGAMRRRKTSARTTVSFA